MSNLNISMTDEAESLPHPGGKVLWITGLSSAGKSTVAGAVYARLRRESSNVTLLDGDQLRSVLQPTPLSGEYDPSARLNLAYTYARLCRLLATQGHTVIIATISLFREVHQWNRKHLPGYVEVFLDVPLHELERRDPKAIYRRFRAGELTQVAGLDLPVDFPASPDLHFKSDEYPRVEDIVTTILNHVEVRS